MSILKEDNPGYSLEGLKLKLQYFGHLMRRANSSGHEFGQTPGDSERQGSLVHCSPRVRKELDTT